MICKAYHLVALSQDLRNMFRKNLARIKKFVKWQQLVHYRKSLMTNKGMSLIPR